MGVVGKDLDVMFSSFCRRGGEEVRLKCQKRVCKVVASTSTATSLVRNKSRDFLLFRIRDVR